MSGAALLLASGVPTPFASSFSAPLPSNAPLDSNSAAIISSFMASYSYVNVARGATGANDYYGTPIWVVQPGQPLVTLERLSSQGAVKPGAPPSGHIPPGVASDGRPVSSGSQPAYDYPVIVTDLLTFVEEYWQLTPNGTTTDPTGYTYSNMGYFLGALSQWDGVWNGAPGYEGTGNGNGAGLAACGLAYLATIPKQWEVAAGVIPHMINIQLPSEGVPGYSNEYAGRSPGTQSDMETSASYATHPQEGMVLRWPTTVSMPGGLAPIAQMLFKAGQDYGILVQDQSGSYQTVLQGPQGQAVDYCSNALDGQEPYAVLDGLPWSSLVALAVPSSWPPGW